MSGYTPLFDSLTRGTLCGKWPDIGLWPVLLSMTDWRGEIDATQQYIAGVTGLPVADVTACIQRFCEPDPNSRSSESGGARLVLTDASRSWGWRVVNIQLYREKASNLKQVADGRNAEKVRRYKERHRQTPADTDGHQETPPNTNSNSNSNSNSNKEKRKTTAPSVSDDVRRDSKRGTRVPIPYRVPPEDSEWAAKKFPAIDQTAATEEFVDFWKAVAGARGCKLDWSATWRNRIRELGRRQKPVNGANRQPTLAEQGW